MEKVMPKDIPHTLHESYDKFVQTTSSKHVTVEELSWFKVSPQLYQHNKGDKSIAYQQRQNNKLMEGVHAYVDNREEFKNVFFVIKDKDLPNQNRGKYKEAYTIPENLRFMEGLEIAYPNRTYLLEPQWNLIESACKAVRDNELLRKFYQRTDFGKSSYMVDEKTGFTIKSRAVALPGNTKMAMFDIRFVENANPLIYAKQLFNQNLHNIAHLNMQCHGRTNYCIFAVEKMAPHLIQPFVLSHEVLEKAKLENRMLLDILMWCKKSNYYPDYAAMGILKSLYTDNYCYEMDIHQTFNVLHQFWEINTGFYNVTLPYYMK